MSTTSQKVVGIRIHHHRAADALKGIQSYFDWATKNVSPLKIRDAIVGAIELLAASLQIVMKHESPEHSASTDEVNRATAQVLLSALCMSLGVPVCRGEHAYLALFGDVLPHRAPVKWCERPVEDAQLNPIDFYKKYWSSYQEKGLLFQIDLRALDPSLFEAIKIFVRRQLKGEDAKDYLPPPYESRLARHSPNTPLPLFAPSDPTPRTDPTNPRVPARRVGGAQILPS